MKSGSSLYGRLTLALLAALVVLGIFYYFKQAEQKKEKAETARQVVERINSPEPLAPAEKRELFDAISGDKIHELGLTEEEQFRLIQEYNKK